MHRIKIVYLATTGLFIYFFFLIQYRIAIGFCGSLSQTLRKPSSDCALASLVGHGYLGMVLRGLNGVSILRIYGVGL